MQLFLLMLVQWPQVRYVPLIMKISIFIPIFQNSSVQKVLHGESFKAIEEALYSFKDQLSGKSVKILTDSQNCVNIYRYYLDSKVVER